MYLCANTPVEIFGKFLKKKKNKKKKKNGLQTHTLDLFIFILYMVTVFIWVCPPPLAGIPVYWLFQACLHQAYYPRFAAPGRISSFWQKLYRNSFTNTIFWWLWLEFNTFWLSLYGCWQIYKARYNNKSPLYNKRLSIINNICYI